MFNIIWHRTPYVVIMKCCWDVLVQDILYITVFNLCPNTLMSHSFNYLFDQQLASIYWRLYCVFIVTTIFCQKTITIARYIMFNQCLTEILTCLVCIGGKKHRIITNDKLMQFRETWLTPTNIVYLFGNKIHINLNISM